LKRDISPSRIDPRVQPVYEWSCRLTAERRQADWLEDYVWQDKVRALLLRLQVAGGSVVAVTGVQGVGKTSAYMALSTTLDMLLRADQGETQKPPSVVVNFKWPGDGKWQDAIWQAGGGTIEDMYHTMLASELAEMVMSNPTFHQRLRREFGDDLFWQLKRRYELKEKEEEARSDFELTDIAIRFMPRKTLIDTRRETIASWLKSAHTVFIDMPDYSRSDFRLMNRDLSLVQGLWSALEGRDRRTNLILFLQEELFFNEERLRHFFLGKMDHVELPRFSPDMLVKAYMDKFHDTWPFDEKALLELAKLSRGVFRRFLRYISACIENSFATAVAQKPPFDIDFVCRAVPRQQIIADVMLELRDLFPKAEARGLALDIIDAVKQTPGMSQTDIAMKLGVDDSRLTRILPKLEEHGHVQRTRGSKGDKLVWPGQS
jgi:CRP-like cAMP-binding protein